MTKRLELEVELEDATHLVVVDQRDFAKLEVQDIPETALTNRTRYLAYSATLRNQLIDEKTAWKEFNEKLCVDARVPEAFAQKFKDSAEGNVEEVTDEDAKK